MLTDLFYDNVSFSCNRAARLQQADIRARRALGSISIVKRVRRSCADGGLEVPAGEGGAGRRRALGMAFEDDPAAFVAGGAGAKIDDPVGERHNR